MMPPARCTSSMWYFCVAGATLHRQGTLRDRRSISAMVKSTPASRAAASRCSTVLVEPPMAMSSDMAFSKAWKVAIERGSAVASSFSYQRLHSSTICRPALRNNCLRSACVASNEPLPGSARPSASARQFIELAVNMPEHEPQVGHAERSMAAISASEFFASAASIMASMRSTARLMPCHCTLPASIGPPETKTAGILRRKAAISMPGVILSQFEMQTMASAVWALHMYSTESAISSRDGRL